MTVQIPLSVGEIAVRNGYLNKDQLEEALLMQTVAGRRNRHVAFGAILLQLGYLNEAQLQELERQHKEMLEGQIQQDLPAEVQEALQTAANRHGKFVSLTLLGRGGMGEVWKAYDLVLRRIVAVKFIPLIRDEDWAMFLNEAELLGKLHHPNIVPLYEIGDRMIVMPYIRGTTLDRIDGDIKKHAAAVQQAALAIHYAHEHGILHRDIKPSNIMVETVGQDRFHVWVMDFGIAGEIGNQAAAAPGAVRGTPIYIAPEQLSGVGQKMDVRSDIYSLGVTLYQACAGPLPFAHADIGKLVRSMVQDNLPLAVIPPDLRAIIRKAMQESPSARYATAAEFAADLEGFLKGEPVQARPAGFLRRCGRNLAQSRLLIAFSIIGLAGGAWGLYGLIGSGAPEPPQSFREKLPRAQEGMMHWRMNGRDSVALEKVMQSVGPLAQKGKFKEAEAALDQALIILSQTVPAPAAAPEPPKSIQEKMSRVQEGMMHWRRNGRDPAVLEKLIQPVGPLLQNGKFTEAEATLDQALTLLNREPSGPGDAIQHKMQMLQNGIQEQMRRGQNPEAIGKIMQEFEPLMKQGKVKEAEAVLDRAIEFLHAGQKP